MGIDQAIEALKDNYEFACTKDYIVNPVGYALYYTWKDQAEEFNRLYQKEIGAGVDEAARNYAERFFKARGGRK